MRRHPRGDTRGFLARLFDAEALRAAGWNGAIAQVNHTHTAQAGTVRGMHYQLPPHAEMKPGRLHPRRSLGRGGGSTPRLAHLPAMARRTPVRRQRLRAADPAGLRPWLPDARRRRRDAVLPFRGLLPRRSRPASFPGCPPGHCTALPPTLVFERDLNHPRLDAAFPGVAL